MTATARRCAYGCDHLAAHGSQVCPRCETFTERTLADLAQTYADLIDPRLLQLPGRSGGDKPPMVGDRAVEGRAQIRGVLVTWCKLLEEDETGPEGNVIRKGIPLPADTVADMAAHVLRHHLRILGSDAAEALVTDCADLARITAWPSRRAGVRIACPKCGAIVQVDIDAEETACACGEWGTVEWWRAQIKPERHEPVTAKEAVAWLKEKHGIDLDANTLNVWRIRGRIDPVSEDEKAHRYDLQDVAILALKMVRSVSRGVA